MWNADGGPGLVSSSDSFPRNIIFGGTGCRNVSVLPTPWPGEITLDAEAVHRCSSPASTIRRFQISHQLALRSWGHSFTISDAEEELPDRVQRFLNPLPRMFGGRNQTITRPPPTFTAIRRYSSEG
jgi:hypothetical protein